MQFRGQRLFLADVVRPWHIPLCTQIRALPISAILNTVMTAIRRLFRPLVNFPAALAQMAPWAVNKIHKTLLTRQGGPTMSF